jgi:hypothetical protein
MSNEVLYPEAFTKARVTSVHAVFGRPFTVNDATPNAAGYEKYTYWLDGVIERD